jgi:hypothetical protein
MIPFGTCMYMYLCGIIPHCCTTPCNAGRRAGKLEEADKPLAAAEAAAAAARGAEGGGRDGGLHYCRGLQQRCTGGSQGRRVAGCGM